MKQTPFATNQVLLALVAVLALVGLSGCNAAPTDSAQPASLEGEATTETYDYSADSGEPQAEAPAEVPEGAAASATPLATPAPASTPKPRPKAAPVQAAAPAPARPAPIVVVVPAGSELRVSLSTPAHSGTSQIGDLLEAVTLDDVVIGNRVAIAAGSVVYGEVIDVVPAKKGLKIAEKGGSLSLLFNRVALTDGTTATVRASLVGSADSGGKTGGIIGGGAAGGAVLGKILGDKTKDTAVGAVIGTGIGTAVAAGTKGKELKFPEGTELLLTLEEDLNVAVE